MKNFLRIIMLVIIVAILVTVGVYLTKDGEANVENSGDILSGEISNEVITDEAEEEIPADVVSGDEVIASGESVAVSGEVVEDTTSGDATVSGETVDAE